MPVCNEEAPNGGRRIVHASAPDNIITQNGKKVKYPRTNSVCKDWRGNVSSDVKKTQQP